MTDDYDCGPCGGEGQQCCGGYYGWCGTGLACGDYGSYCEKCGLSGQPCCDGAFCITGPCSSGTCP
jgi:hypothetical protein